MPKACTVRHARNSDQNAKRGVAHRSNESRRYSASAGAWPHRATDPARPRRRGDRIAMSPFR
jgi:hypothetical protein